MKKIVIVLFIIALVLIGFYFFNEKKDVELVPVENNEQTLLNNIKNNYNISVKTNKTTDLYKLDNNAYIKVGIVNEGVSLNLEKVINIDINNKYFKLDNLDYFVYYTDVEKINMKENDQDYQNYIVFNENVITKDITNFYNEDGLVYSINESFDIPIIIKTTDKKYVVYDNQLLYIKTEDITQIKTTNNTDEKISNGIRVMTYHQFYDNKKGDKCGSIICHEVTVFNEQMQYLYDNNYYTVDMKTLEMFLDGQIRLPQKSVVITIDDGGTNITSYAYPIIEKYKIHATLFLITSRYNKNDYESPFIEIHSHGHNIHNTGVCPGGQGSPIKCLEKEALLTDLKTSREELNDTNIFCYPFYEYNDYAISVLKEAGFTMAFANVGYKIKPGDNKMTLSRYTVLSTISFSEYINMVK